MTTYIQGNCLTSWTFSPAPIYDFHEVLTKRGTLGMSGIQRNWVSSSSLSAPVRAEVRVHNLAFTTDLPALGTFKAVADLGMELCPALSQEDAKPGCPSSGQSMSLEALLPHPNLSQILAARYAGKGPVLAWGVEGLGSHCCGK